MLVYKPFLINVFINGLRILKLRYALSNKVRFKCSISYKDDAI